MERNKSAARDLDRLKNWIAGSNSVYRTNFALILMWSRDGRGHSLHHEDGRSMILRIICTIPQHCMTL